MRELLIALEMEAEGRRARLNALFPDETKLKKLLERDDIRDEDHLLDLLDQMNDSYYTMSEDLFDDIAEGLGYTPDELRGRLSGVEEYGGFSRCFNYVSRAYVEAKFSDRQAPTMYVITVSSQKKLYEEAGGSDHLMAFHHRFGWHEGGSDRVIADRGWHVVMVDEHGMAWDNLGVHGQAEQYLDALIKKNRDPAR